MVATESRSGSRWLPLADGSLDQVGERQRPVTQPGRQRRGQPCRRASADDPRLRLDTLIARAEAVIDVLGLVPLDRRLLLAAGALSEPALRALDAMHVAAAVGISPIDAFVSYDERQSAAARLAGLRTTSPGASPGT